MANAMNILGDNEIIYKVSLGKELKIYPIDDKIAELIKIYINIAFENIFEFEVLYNIKYESYKKYYNEIIKKANRPDKYPKHKYWNMQNSIHSIEFKVNHLRQKYWYWKKLKE